MEKRCSQCGVAKSLDQFSLSRRGVRGQPIYRGECKSCASKQAQKWFRDHPEQNAANKRRWNLQKLYGVTVVEYEERLAAQGGVCAICGREGRGHRLAVDHCHDTGRIRGLLCHPCNRAIGLLGDNVDLLRKAIDYLERK